MPGLNGGTLKRGGSPGRPRLHDTIVGKIRKALVADGPEDTMGIVDALISEARKGKEWAITLCLAYGIGKPTEHIDASFTLTTITATLPDHERAVLASVIRKAIDEAPEDITEAEVVEVE